MKKGWQTKKLGELCEIELGRTPSRANSALWDEKRETSNVWLSIADLLNANDNVVVDSKEYVSDKGGEICKLVPKGTLLVSFKLTLGRLAFAGRDLFTNEAIAALTIVNERELLKEFLFYFLHFFDWVKAAENDVKLKGMTLNKAKLKEMDVHFPKSLPDQRRIVGLLDEAFAGIATAKANAEKNLQNARALFESHLQSVFTQRGRGWVESTIGETCTLKSGTTVSPNLERRVGEIPYLKVADMTFNGNENEIKTSSRFLLEADAKEIAIIPKGATIFPKRGGAILTNKKRITLVPICADLNIMAVIPSSRIDARLLYFYFLNVDMRKLGTGSSIPQINNYDIAPLKISFPESVNEQHKIMDKLELLREETQRLARLYERKLAALEALKKSLLHQAFAGEL